MASMGHENRGPTSLLWQGLFACDSTCDSQVTCKGHFARIYFWLHCSQLFIIFIELIVALIFKVPKLALKHVPPWHKSLTEYDKVSASHCMCPHLFYTYKLPSSLYKDRFKSHPLLQYSHSNNHEYHFMSVRTEQNSIWHAVNGHCNSVTTVSPPEELRSSLYNKPCS